MTRALLAVALTAALLPLSGCGVLPTACTEKGCLSGVNFTLGQRADLFELDQPVVVRACIETACAEETLTATTPESGAARVYMTEHFTLNLDDQTLRYNQNAAAMGDDPSTVTLRLTRNGTVVLDETRQNVTFSQYQPNGPGCEPVCRSSGVTL